MANPNPTQSKRFKATQKPKHERELSPKVVSTRYPIEVYEALLKLKPDDRQELIRLAVERSLREQGKL